MYIIVNLTVASQPSAGDRCTRRMRKGSAWRLKIEVVRKSAVPFIAGYHIVLRVCDFSAARAPYRRITKTVLSCKHVAFQATLA